MAQKLWEKSVQVNKDIERFTVGRDTFQIPFCIISTPDSEI